MGAVHVRLDDEGLTISNPGGLVDGVTLANLLVTEPRPRNRALADAMKRIGVVERSGRGVDAIYRGMLRYGRREPENRRTDAQNVVLRLATDDAERLFLRLVVEEEGRRTNALPIDALIVLAALNGAKRLSVKELAPHIQRDAVQTKRRAVPDHRAEREIKPMRGFCRTPKSPMYQHVDTRIGGSYTQKFSRKILAMTNTSLRVEQTVQTWGNGLAVRLTAPVARAAHLARGVPVSVEVVEGGIFLRVTGKAQQNLAQKLKAFDPQRHGGEAMGGGRIGVEVF